MKNECRDYISLLASYGAKKEDVEIISFKDALLGKDPSNIITYMKGLGFCIKEASDLLSINEDDTEEELFAYRCKEGILISHCSDGLWFLFTY